MVAVALSGSEIREKFLQFFESKQHKRLASASLIPEDPTVLLTIAGMLPFKPIFMGKQEAPAPRVTTSQKCVRTNDIENVGRTKRHHTFFEMLGNFSFGDYFKREAISWAWELVTQVYQLPPERLWVSVYTEDEEAFVLWQEVAGIPAHRIQKMGADSNFWESGSTGPCGPCSEIYYDFALEKGEDNIDLEDDSRFLEIYNLVFMQLNKDSDGKLTELPRKNIDTGMGLERVAQVLQGVPNNYETDLVLPIIQKAAAIAGRDYFQVSETEQVSLKIIGDHTRAAVHLIADGVKPGNEGRDYVLRRLIRRMVRRGRQIGIPGAFTAQVAAIAIQLMGSAFPNLLDREKVILDTLANEEKQFLRTLETGEKLLAEILERAQGSVSGEDAFLLYDTYGFPLELTVEAAEERGLTVDASGYAAKMTEQRERAKAAAKTIDLTTTTDLSQIPATVFVGYQQLSSDATVLGVLAQNGADLQIILDTTPFYAEGGGQVGDRGYLNSGEMIVEISDVRKQGEIYLHIGKLQRGVIEVGMSIHAHVSQYGRRLLQSHHTATHLLQAALRQIFGSDVQQAGSLVAYDRLRFDFSAPRALTPEEIAKIETQVNTWIVENHSVSAEVMSMAEAQAKGALAFFGDKYGDIVRVLEIPGVSTELCGGTHAEHTIEIGPIKIISETGIAAGVRRIEAVAGLALLDYVRTRDQVTQALSNEFKVQVEQIPERVGALLGEVRQANKQVESLKAALALARAEVLLTEAEQYGSFKVIVAQLGDTEAEPLKSAAEFLQAKIGEGAVVLGSTPEADKVSIVAAFSPQAIAKGLNAGKFVGEIAKLTGGGGGGRPNIAQAGGKQPEKLQTALDEAFAQLYKIFAV
jgi:alanyl-tRNA synthetase